MRGESPAAADSNEKIIVEHTNINPNKAAHIGHLRNAALGDTFVRMLRSGGKRVEVQNYIDNTGVQVADVVVGFHYLEKKSLADVEALLADPTVRFDYYCWDLYAYTSSYYKDHAESLPWRSATAAIRHGPCSSSTCTRRDPSSNNRNAPPGRPAAPPHRPGFSFPGSGSPPPRPPPARRCFLYSSAPRRAGPWRASCARTCRPASRCAGGQCGPPYWD